MNFVTKLVSFVVCAGLIATSSLSMGDDSKVVFAIVDGKEITSDDVLTLTRSKEKIDFDKLDEQQKRELVDSLITQRVVLDQAIQDGFDQTDEIAATVKALTDSFIVKQYIVKVATGFDLSDEVLKMQYEEKYLKAPDQYRINHILLKTEDEADAIILLLNNGADFSNLAKSKSQDRISAEKGGDLGWLTSDDMVPSFFRAVTELAENEISSKPAKTQFGWHIIRLEQKREVTAPPFNEVKQVLRQDLIRKKIAVYIDELKANAKIEIK